MLKKIPKVGDKVRVLNSNGWGRLVKGQEYEVTAVIGGYFDLHDGFDRYDIIASIEFERDFELVVESIEKGSGIMANTLTEMPKVSDKVRYVSGHFNDYVTLGHVYEINEVKHGCAYFIDDDNDPHNRSTIYAGDFGHFELVTESSPDIRDLLANIGRRLSEVEAELAQYPKADVNYEGRYQTELAEDVTDNVTAHKGICAELTDIFARKNADYGDSFSQQFDENGILTSVIRLDDKMRRIKQLTVSDAKVNDESIEDTLLDLANYSIMTLMELRK